MIRSHAMIYLFKPHLFGSSSVQAGTPSYLTYEEVIFPTQAANCLSNRRDEIIFFNTPLIYKYGLALHEAQYATSK